MSRTRVQELAAALLLVCIFIATGFIGFDISPAAGWFTLAIGAAFVVGIAAAGGGE